MAEVDFGDSELFEQLGDSSPRVPKHSRFTHDEEEQEDMSQLRSRLEDCEEYNGRLTEENILPASSTSQWLLATVTKSEIWKYLFHIIYLFNSQIT